jgi:hypothetical protein
MQVSKHFGLLSERMPVLQIFPAALFAFPEKLLACGYQIPDRMVL